MHTLKILLVTWNGSGNFPPQLALARHLRQQDHDIRVLAHPLHRSRVEAIGLRFLAHGRLPDLYSGDPFSVPVDSWWDDVFFSSGSGADVAAVLNDDPADVAIVDCLLWGDQAAAEANGVPTVVFVHTLYGRFIGDNSGEQLPERVGALNRTRAGWGLAAVSQPRQAWEGSPCVLVASASVLDLPNLPENVLHVGPLRHDESSATATAELPRGKPLVLISFSTSKLVVPRTVQRVLDAVAGLPVQGLLTTGDHLQQTMLDVPANVAVSSYVPHSVAMPHVDLVVTHAGHGTVMAALSASVPLVCLPSIADQPFISSRVQELGAGRTIPSTSPAEHIRDVLAKVLWSPSYRAKAREVAEAIRSELDPDRAAAAVVAAAQAPTSPVAGGAECTE